MAKRADVYRKVGEIHDRPKNNNAGWIIAGVILLIIIANA